MTPTFKIFNEMETHFINRTKNHVNLVRKYAEKIELAFPELKGVYNESLVHDASKFEEPEYSPYLHVNWKYKIANEGGVYTPPSDIKDSMDLATEHHVKSNKHHPEFWSDQINVINKIDRDKPPSKIVDASKMPNISLAEMCADWMAVAEERNNDPLKWADNNVNLRWKFTDEQKKLIYDIIEKVWKK